MWPTYRAYFDEVGEDPAEIDLPAPAQSADGHVEVGRCRGVGPRRDQLRLIRRHVGRRRRGRDGVEVAAPARRDAVVVGGRPAQRAAPRAAVVLDLSEVPHDPIRLIDDGATARRTSCSASRPTIFSRTVSRYRSSQWSRTASSPSVIGPSLRRGSRQGVTRSAPPVFHSRSMVVASSWRLPAWWSRMACISRRIVSGAD